MKNKVDLVIKLAVTALIIIVMAIMVIPSLQDLGILDSGSSSSTQADFPGGDQMPSDGQMPSGGQMSAGGGEQDENSQIPASDQAAVKESQGANAQMSSGGEVTSDSQMPSDGQIPSGGGPQGEGSTSFSIQAIMAATAEIGTVSDFIKVNGDIVSDTEIDIYPDVSGKVVKCPLSVGDEVKLGQAVALVDPSLPGQNYADSEVYSTINGTVLAVNVHVGDTVSTNTSVITVGDLSNLKVETYIPEKYIGNLHTGLPAEVSFAAYPDLHFDAEISSISPVLDPESRTLEIRLNIDNEEGKIKAGMFASIILITNQVNDVVTIPAVAVFTYYNNDTVYVINSDNTVEKRTVEVGLATVEMVEIKSGLSSGEMVVTEGQSLLSDGSEVKIASEEF